MRRRSSASSGAGADGHGPALSWMGDPRRYQVAFAALALLDVGIRVALGYRFGLLTPTSLGLLGLAVVLVVTFVVPWRRLDVRLALLVPLAGLAYVGAIRLTPEGGNGLLITFPALWLGRQWARTGAVVAGLGSVLLVFVPGVLYADGNPALVSRAIFLPIVATVTALAIAEGMAQVRAHGGEMEVQHDHLARALETIARHQRVNQAVFDTVDVGLVLLDADGRYVTMNRRHDEFMALGHPDGHDGHAGYPGHVFDVDGRTPLAEHELPSARAASGEEFDDLRIWIGADPGSRRALSVSARTLRDEGGDVEGAALAYTDVTDLMRALRIKDDFVALVSHELRTPLTSIVGYVQILEDDTTLPPHAVAQLRVVHRNAERLRRLIADLLDTAQRDGSPMPINRTETDLAALVAESVEAARPAAGRADVGLVAQVPASLSARLDAQRVAQAVDNLVSNAIKYTEPRGQVTVTLTEAGGEAVVEVADTGIGIAADDLERLFTRFFRTEDASRRAVAGAGLGLSITKDIVESHGGRIEVESARGTGSTFRVRLPLTDR